MSESKQRRHYEANESTFGGRVETLLRLLGGTLPASKAAKLSEPTLSNLRNEKPHTVRTLEKLVTACHTAGHGWVTVNWLRDGGSAPDIAMRVAMAMTRGLLNTAQSAPPALYAQYVDAATNFANGRPTMREHGHQDPPGVALSYTASVGPIFRNHLDGAARQWGTVIQVDLATPDFPRVFANPQERDETMAREAAARSDAAGKGENDN